MKGAHRPFLSGWVRALVTALPLLSLCLGVVLLIEALRFYDSASATEGKVIELIRDTSGDGISYTPVIEYHAHDGRIYLGETHTSSSGYNYRIGERVHILYSLDAPGEVRINTTFSLYGPGLILAAAGGLFLLILRFVRRRTVRPNSGFGEIDRRKAQAHRKTEQMEQPTTDPSQYGHIHEPKPRREPTVRRMR